MSMKLLSRGETNENNSFNNPKIEGAEQEEINENAFETEYLIEYHMEVSTPKNSLAKTYEDKNEMIAILEVPKSDYKNENIQKLLKWAHAKVRDDYYYHDIAVYVQMAETFERSIVFTHANISINEESEIKSDFVTMTVTINQKRDKFAGVMFGDDIDSTYKKAWKKVLNPPRLNIYVPVITKQETKEFAPVLNKDAYGIKINKESKVTYTPCPPHRFYYADGPEDISESYTKKILLKYDAALDKGKTDFEFYYKSSEKNKSSICIVLKNISNEPTDVYKIKSYYFNMPVLELEDEKYKEEYCTNVELNFLSTPDKQYNDSLKEARKATDKRITLNSNEEYTIFKFDFCDINNAPYEKSIGKKELQEGFYNKRRIYGRARIICDEGGKIQARVVLVPETNAKIGKCNLLTESNSFPDTTEKTNQTGQFSGVLNYTELNVNVSDMKKGEYIMVGDYSKEGDPKEVTGGDTGNGPADGREYPVPLYYDTRERYKYFFGNFGIIYNFTFTNPESNIFKIYPFGHNWAEYAFYLLNTNGSWQIKGPIDIREGMTNGQKDHYNLFNKNNDKPGAVNYANNTVFPQASIDIKINNNKFSFLLPGGNCACLKIKMI